MDNKSKSVFNKELFSSKKSKTMFLIIIGIALLALATFVWAIQKGKIAMFASTTSNTKTVEINTYNEWMKNGYKTCDTREVGLYGHKECYDLHGSYPDPYNTGIYEKYINYTGVFAIFQSGLGNDPAGINARYISKALPSSTGFSDYKVKTISVGLVSPLSGEPVDWNSKLITIKLAPVASNPGHAKTDINDGSWVTVYEKDKPVQSGLGRIPKGPVYMMVINTLGRSIIDKVTLNFVKEVTPGPFGLTMTKDCEVSGNDQNVTLRWNVQSGAQSYSREWQCGNDVGTNIWATAGSVPPSQTTMTFKQGKNEKCVYRINASGTSSNDSITVDKCPPPGAPDPPTISSSCIYVKQGIQEDGISISKVDNYILQHSSTGKDEEGAWELLHSGPFTDGKHTSQHQDNFSVLYRVRSYKKTGDNHVYSAWVWNTGPRCNAPIPSAPINFKATADSNDCHKIDLSWDKVENATSYKIFRNTDSYNQPIKTTSETNFTDIGLTEKTKHTYRVKAVNKSGESSHAEANATTPECPHVEEKPTAPGNLKAFLTSETCSGVRLTWEESTGATIDHYQIIATNDLSKTAIDINTGKILTYTFSNLTPNATYTFVVRAYTKPSNGKVSDPAQATAVLPDCPGPIPPPDPELTCEEKCQSLGLGVNRCGETGSTGPDAPPACNENENDVGSTSDCKVEEGIVGMHKSCCCSKAPVTIPINLKIDSAHRYQINLSWDIVDGTNAIGYNIYNGNDKLIGQSLSNQFSAFGDFCEGNNTTFYVKAFNALSTESDPSNTVSAENIDCGGALDKPTNFTVTVDGQYMITLEWDPVTGANIYDIYDCSGNLIVSTTDPFYVFDGLKCETEYCYFVVARNYQGNISDPSDKVSGTTEDCDDGTIITTGDKTGGVGIKGLVSTGGALWFNILLAILLTGSLGYLIFRKDIWKREQ